MRLIDADALKASYIVPGTTTNSLCHLYVSLKDINNAPTIEAEPVRHGRWEYIGGYGYQHRCSKCFMCAGYRTNYCPNCGTLMDKGADNE